MKRILIYALAGVYAALAVSCDSLLNLESETRVTTNYLYTTKDGLQRAMAGLYIDERDRIVDASNEKSIVYLLQTMDFSTDIILFRAGNCARVARLDQLNPDSDECTDFWVFHYGLIGKANEIIASALKLGIDDPEVASVYGEASLMRGRSYFELWKRYERIYINLEPTTVNNLVRTYHPATKEEVFKVIKDDLDNAVKYVGWARPVLDGKEMYGRYTKAVAKHVRAQVAMWEEDWDKAIEECEDIFTDGKTWCEMEKDPADVFNSADYRSKEVLFAYQFSKNVGGGGVVNGSKLIGHPISVYVTSQYRSIAGCVSESSQGGYGFGRIFPNTHLLGLYGPEDTRKDKYFRNEFFYNDPASPKFGQVVTPEDAGSNYCRNIHPMSVKHADFWTNEDQPDRQSSFRDLLVYRLAETYLMACEAYFHKEGGSSAKAIEYFNKTYQRAGNAPFSGTLTLEDILDEYARELNFEGVRWGLLKRLGLLESYCRQFSGDSRADDPYLSEDYIHARTSFVHGKHDKWPIPSDQILLMGAENFPQTDGWN